MRLADFRGALAVARKAATFAEAAKDQAGQLIVDFTLGTSYHYIGDQAAAQFYSERGIARAAEPGTSIPNFFRFDQRNLRSHQPRPRVMAARLSPIRRAEIAKSAINEIAEPS